MDNTPRTSPLSSVRSARRDRLDLDAALAMLTDDIHYHNIPMPALDGIAAVEAYLRQAAAAAAGKAA